MINNEQGSLVKAIEDLHEQLLKQELVYDTSQDGVVVLETDEGSCIQVTTNGITSLMSFDVYEKLINIDWSIKK